MDVRIKNMYTYHSDIYVWLLYDVLKCTLYMNENITKERCTFMSTTWPLISLIERLLNRTRETDTSEIIL